jgi:hypothetical protein
MDGSVPGEQSFDELSDKGFRLAYFILRDRTLAIQSLTDAWNKLNARCRQEGKRAYWRDKYLKRRLTKISRSDGDTLQWLIYFECDDHEKEKERKGQSTPEELVIHYIKSIIQMTTGMSSFYVAVGLHRLLHEYSTSDVQRAYEIVTDRYLEADEYRRAKRFLMNKLVTRFGSLLRSVTTAHGEVRFEPVEDQGRWVNLVRECLDFFTPWSTKEQCLVPTNFGQAAVTLPPELSGAGNNSATADAIETNRCHAFIHSVCYGRLVKALGSDPPEDKLALPRFVPCGAQGGNDRSENPPTPPALTPDEKGIIRTNLASQSARRKAASGQALRIAVDGGDRGEIQLRSQKEATIELEAGARLIVISTVDKNGEIVLATHLLHYSASGKIRGSTAAVHSSGAEVSLVVSRADETGTAHLRLINHRLINHQCQPRNDREPIALYRSYALRYALALLFVGIGLALGVIQYHKSLSFQRSRIELLEREVALARSSSGPLSRTLRPDTTFGMVTRELVPYDRSTRGGGTAEPVAISLPPGSTLLRLNIPLRDARSSFKAVLKTLPRQKEILTEAIPATAKSGTRNVFVTVPTALLSSNADYILELKSETSSDATIFIFHIEQKTP